MVHKTIPSMPMVISNLTFDVVNMMMNRLAELTTFSASQHKIKARKKKTITYMFLIILIHMSKVFDHLFIVQILKWLLTGKGQNLPQGYCKWPNIGFRWEFTLEIENKNSQANKLDEDEILVLIQAYVPPPFALILCRPNSLIQPY